MDASSSTKIGIVGAGLMGHGIALQFALRGCDVMLNDLDDQRLADALANVKINLGVLRGLGLAGEEDEQAVPARIHTSTSLEESMTEVDFVVEAVFEDMPLKLSVFEALDKACPAHTVLTSNTSSFMTSQLAPATKRPDKVLVANWWNPPYLLPLIEVVRGPDTSDEALDITTGIFERIGKKPVVLQKESLGFIGNRLQFALLREALSIVAAGIASPEDVDTVVTSSFGRRLAVAGPLEVFDLAGWGHHIAHHRPAIPRDRVVRRFAGDHRGDGRTRRARGEVRQGLLRVGRRGCVCAPAASRRDARGHRPPLARRVT